MMKNTTLVFATKNADQAIKVLDQFVGPDVQAMLIMTVVPCVQLIKKNAKIKQRLY